MILHSPAKGNLEFTICDIRLTRSRSCRVAIKFHEIASIVYRKS